MSIDGCQYSFSHLANVILPQYMERLKKHMRNPLSMAEFAISGRGPATIARELGLSGDFSGCYVLLEGERPMYVGISRMVLARLRQHVIRRSHYDATLAYTMAARQAPHRNTRNGAMRDPAFYNVFLAACEKLGQLHVAFVEIENPAELHLFEVYCALELGTCEWNSFQTH